MIRTKASISLILLVSLMVSLVLSVACSKGDSSAWVGATPLEEALSNGKPTVAEFGAATCIPCKRMKPILEELAAEYGDRLNMSFVDVFKQPDLANRYAISLIPTQIFFDTSGQEVTRHVGFWPKEEIMAHLEELGLL
ncbi:MAG: thioredoxin family protein [Chloroflexi bacterium]|nr:thioredoxin family protein [Chloroflexota bacterium]